MTHKCKYNHGTDTFILMYKNFGKYYIMLTSCYNTYNKRISKGSNLLSKGNQDSPSCEPPITLSSCMQAFDFKTKTAYLMTRHFIECRYCSM